MIAVLWTVVFTICVRVNPISSVVGGKTSMNVSDILDGDTSTYASSSAVHGDQISIQLVDAFALKKIEIYPREGFMNRTFNGQFYAVVATSPVDRQLVAQVPVSTDLTDRWVSVPLSQNVTTQDIIFLPPSSSFGDLAELRITVENRQLVTYTTNTGCNETDSSRVSNNVTQSVCENLCIRTGDCQFVSFTSKTSNPDRNNANVILGNCSTYTDCTNVANPSQQNSIITLRKSIFECTETPTITVLPPVATATATIVNDSDDGDAVLLIVLIIVIVLLCLLFLLYYFLKNKSGKHEDYLSNTHGDLWDEKEEDPSLFKHHDENRGEINLVPHAPVPPPFVEPVTPYVPVREQSLPLIPLHTIPHVTERDSEAGMTSSSFTDQEADQVVSHHTSRPRRSDQRSKLPPIGSALLLKDSQIVDVIRSQSNKGILCQYKDGERKWVPQIHINKILHYGNENSTTSSGLDDSIKTRRSLHNSNPLQTFLRSEKKHKPDSYSDVSVDDDDEYHKRKPHKLLRSLGIGMDDRKSSRKSKIPGVSIGDLQLASLQGSWKSSIGVELAVDEDHVVVDDGREFSIKTREDGISLNRIRVSDKLSTPIRLVWEDGEVWNRLSTPLHAGRSSGIRSQVSPTLQRVNLALKHRSTPASRRWDKL